LEGGSGAGFLGAAF
jgi:3-oxoacyl-[acyl-carrier-protein] synthase-3